MKKFCLLLILIVSCLGFTFAQENKPLQILEIPFPEIKKEQRNIDFQGTITLRIEFLDSGKIGIVTVISDISADFIDDVVAAAKQIKFNPKIEGRKPITLYKTFQYSFSWSKDWQTPSLRKPDDLKSSSGTNEIAEVAIFVQEDKPLRILEKPQLAYPVPDTGTICVQGTVTLRVEFLASSKIGKISPVSSLGYGLTENAMEAAKKIKFEPAVKNGKPITVTKPIQFSFTIY